MATTTDYMAARGDADLLVRLIAKAELMGIDNASQWIQENMSKLVNVAVGEGQTITDIFTYANTVRQAALDAVPPRAGINLAAVTDTHLQTAIELVQPVE